MISYDGILREFENRLPNEIRSRLPPDQNKRKLYLSIGGFLSLVLLFDVTNALLLGEGVKSSIIAGSFASSESSSDDDRCANVVVNGDFDEGTTHWKFIGKDTGLVLISPQVTIEERQRHMAQNENAPAMNGSGTALSTMQRENWYDGMSQDLDVSCLSKQDYYEVSANVMIHDYSGKTVSCEPFKYHFDPETSCPTLALKLEGKDKTLVSRPIAHPVGPWNPNGWNQVYGLFEATPDLFKQNRVELYVTNAAAGFNEVIDNVVIKRVSTSTFGLRTCSQQLIMNGNAAFGDARFWYVKGGGPAGEYGTLDVIWMGNPNATPEERLIQPRYAFHHHGKRTQWWNGMWQKLDQNCMAVGSRWKISFGMKLLDPSGEQIWCDNSKTGSCPNVSIESITIGKGSHPISLSNELNNYWKIGKFNLFEATFEMTPVHKGFEETWFYITNVEPGHGYIVENISMIPLAY